MPPFTKDDFPAIQGQARTMADTVAEVLSPSQGGTGTVGPVAKERLQAVLDFLRRLAGGNATESARLRRTPAGTVRLLEDRGKAGRGETTPDDGEARRAKLSRLRRGL